MNTFGTLFRLTSFGESHGEAVGGVIDGCPAGFPLDLALVQQELDRRRPGQSSVSTPRKESDTVEFLSGLYNGLTTGTPIAFMVRNTNQQSGDYSELAQTFRPSHADYTYQQKYGIRDPRGGGRASARTTISQCVAGAVAKQILAKQGITITGYASQIGTITLGDILPDYSLIEQNIVRCPHATTAEQMVDAIHQARTKGDSIGGVVSCAIEGVPAGWGEPLFDKLSARLAYAMMGINAAKAFEIGDGFALAALHGSEANDSFITTPKGTITTATNHSGGIQGGLSNGNTITFRTAFKPTPTIAINQQTVTHDGNEITLKARGRHDPCVVPRAVPVVEAMAAMVILDFYLLNRAQREVE